MDRVIFHADCNSFFASVECLDHPELKNVPMAVAGDPKSRGGIILAKNDLAKRYGVQTAETIWQARRKCPGLVLVAPHGDRYGTVSRQVKAIFRSYTDQVESFGIDEAWLDVTGSLRYFESKPRALADRIREQVKHETGVTVSVGVSFNKVFAKLGSDMKKPDATTVISRENYQRLVWPLPAGDLLFVGRAAAGELQKRYIYTIGDIARQERAEMGRIFGKGGDMLWRHANGMDDDPVRRYYDREPVKSVGNGMTFPRDLLGEDELRMGVMALADEVADRLRGEHMKCRAVQLTIKNPQLRVISRQKQLLHATHLRKELVDAAMALLRENWRMDAPVRALTVTAIHLSDENELFDQQSLFCMGTQGDPAAREKLERVEDAVVRIRRKHGDRSITIGWWKDAEIGLR